MEIFGNIGVSISMKVEFIIYKALKAGQQQIILSHKDIQTDYSRTDKFIQRIGDSEYNEFFNKNVFTNKESSIGVWRLTHVTSNNGQKPDVEYTLNFVPIDVDYLPKKDVFIDESEINKYEEELLETAGIKKHTLYICKDGYFHKFIGCSVIQVTDYEKTRSLSNPHGFTIEKDHIAYNFISEKEHDAWGTEVNMTNKFHYTNIEQILKEDYLEVGFSADLFLSSVNTYMEGGVPMLKETLSLGESDEGGSSTDIVGVASKEHLEQLREIALEKTNFAKTLSRGVKREALLREKTLQAQIRNQMNQINQVKSFIAGQIAILGKKIQQMTRLIVTLEIYAGINENVYQIREGSPSETGVISLRQKKIYLDEEIAIYEDQGLDWDGIEQFDEWVRNTDHIFDILPEEKCVVVCDVRREAKTYGWIENVFSRAMAEEATKKVMILFRNGENIYRIWSEHLSNTNGLFPLRSKITELYDEIQKNQEVIFSDSQSEYYKKDAEKKIEDAEDYLFLYKKNILMLHGVFSRTEIMGTLPNGVSMMKPDSYEGHIKFIYDDEMAIGSGTEKFADWLARVNTSIKHGARVFLSEEVLHSYGNRTADDLSDRYNMYWSGIHTRPQLPISGIYQVKKEKEKVINRVNDIRVSFSELDNYDLKEFDEVVSYGSFDEDKRQYILRKKTPQEEYIMQDVLKISYDQNADSKKIGHGFYSEPKRSKNPRWTIFRIEEKDKFIINIDEVTVDEIDGFIKDKSQRENYLVMFPVLLGLKKYLVSERENERVFAKSMSERVALEHGISDDILQHTMDSIHWYKNKLATVIKRALPTDNSAESAKAWRLIELDLKRKLKKIYKLKIDVSGISGAGTYSYSHKFSSEVFDHEIMKHVKESNVSVEAANRKEAADKIYSWFYRRFTDRAMRKITKKRIYEMLGFSKG